METQICSLCNKELLLSEYHFKNKTTGQLKTYCKDCAREIGKRSYSKHKEVVKEKARKQKLAYRKQYREWKSTFSCVLCNESASECIDFHHLDEKTKEFSIAEACGYASLSRVIEEAKKCIAVCSNCHRKIHSERIKI